MRQGECTCAVPGEEDGAEPGAGGGRDPNSSGQTLDTVKRSLRDERGHDRGPGWTEKNHGGREGPKQRKEHPQDMHKPL